MTKSIRFISFVLLSLSAFQVSASTQQEDLPIVETTLVRQDGDWLTGQTTSGSIIYVNRLTPRVPRGYVRVDGECYYGESLIACFGPSKYPPGSFDCDSSKKGTDCPYDGWNLPPSRSEF